MTRLRVDRQLQRILRADAAGDVDLLRRLAARLKSHHPHLGAWCDYVTAGCHVLTGRRADALTVLSTAVSAGAWWSARLLADPALDPLWATRAGRALRERSVTEAEEVAATSSPVLRRVPAAAAAGPAPGLTVLVLHGNGPSPEDLYASHWSTCGALVGLLRSSQPLCAGVYDWSDEARSRRDVDWAIGDLVGDGDEANPVVVAGLGAGGRLALDHALTGHRAVAGTMTFSPALAPLLERHEPRGPPVVPSRGRHIVVSGGRDGAAESCTRFAAVAPSLGLDVTLVHRHQVGHEYPPDVRALVRDGLTAIRSALP